MRNHIRGETHRAAWFLDGDVVYRARREAGRPLMSCSRPAHVGEMVVLMPARDVYRDMSDRAGWMRRHPLAGGPGIRLPVVRV